MGYRHTREELREEWLDDAISKEFYLPPASEKSKKEVI